MVLAKSDRGYECGREGDRTQGLASMSDDLIAQARFSGYTLPDSVFRDIVSKTSISMDVEKDVLIFCITAYCSCSMGGEDLNTHW